MRFLTKKLVTFIFALLSFVSYSQYGLVWSAQDLTPWLNQIVQEVESYADCKIPLHKTGVTSTDYATLQRWKVLWRIEQVNLNGK